MAAKGKAAQTHLGSQLFTVDGKPAQQVQLQEGERSMVVLLHGNEQALAVAWDTDPSGYQFFRIRQIKMEEGFPVTKELRRGEVGVAFYGEVSVVGAGNNDLYTSDGFDDPDQVDREGNVINKVREIRIYPRRHD